MPSLFLSTGYGEEIVMVVAPRQPVFVCPMVFVEFIISGLRQADGTDWFQLPRELAEDCVILDPEERGLTRAQGLALKDLCSWKMNFKPSSTFSHSISFFMSIFCSFLILILSSMLPLSYEVILLHNLIFTLYAFFLLFFVDFIFFF